jgi:ParB/RepB/Spo0J family partition protein
VPKPTKPALPRFGGLLAASEPGTPLAGARALPQALLDPSPWQPRQHFDADRLQELAADIAARGILEPLIVRPVGARYEIIAGGRRFAAAGLAALETVPCLIQEWDDTTARGATIAENIHREDLTPEDEARYYAWLEGLGMSHREIGAAIGKSHNYVGRRLRLLSEPGALEAYHAGERGLEPERAESGTGRTSMEQTVTENEPAPAGYGPLPSTDSTPAIAPATIKGQSVFKPFVAAHRHAQTITPATLSPTDRADLAATVGELITELQGLKAELEG